MGAYRGRFPGLDTKNNPWLVGRVKPDIRTSNGGYHTDREAVGCLVGVLQRRSIVAADSAAEYQTAAGSASVSANMGSWLW